MIEIEGSQLDIIRKLFGTVRGPGSTIIEDDQVIQTLPVVPEIVRRGNTPTGSAGLFMGVMHNVHSGADDERSTLNPYEPGAFAANQFPAAISDAFDIWVLDAVLTRASGAGNADGAQLRLGAQGSEFLGFAVTDSALFIDSGLTTILAAFGGTTNADAAAGFELTPEVGTGKLIATVNRRIRRGMTMILDTTSSAAATFDLAMTLGLFPAGMGQDVLG